MSDVMNDLVVIGGGVAGLSAAVAVARFGKRVEVIDAGVPRNAATDGVHNLLGREGVAPLELTRTGRAELAGYGGVVTPGRAVGVRRDDGGFVLTLDSGRAVAGRRLIVASGVRDTLPDVAGLETHWGADVLHCPFCHGWEVRGRALVVLATNPMAVHQAQMFRELSDNVTVVTHGSEIDEEGRRLLVSIGVEVVDGPAAQVLDGPDGITGLRLSDGRIVPCGAIGVAPQADERSAVLDELGVPRSEDLRIGYEHDQIGATQVPGVWVAGNTGEPFAAVPIAIASGLTAAAGVIQAMVADRAAAALATRP